MELNFYLSRSHLPSQDPSSQPSPKFNPSSFAYLENSPKHLESTHVDVVVATPGDVGRVPRGWLQIEVFELDFQGAALRTPYRPPACWNNINYVTNCFLFSFGTCTYEVIKSTEGGGLHTQKQTKRRGCVILYMTRGWSKKTRKFADLTCTSPGTLTYRQMCLCGYPDG